MFLWNANRGKEQEDDNIWTARLILSAGIKATTEKKHFAVLDLQNNNNNDKKFKKIK